MLTSAPLDRAFLIPSTCPFSEDSKSKVPYIVKNVLILLLTWNQNYFYIRVEHSYILNELAINYLATQTIHMQMFLLLLIYLPTSDCTCLIYINTYVHVMYL